jgi:cell division topological specificity factor
MKRIADRFSTRRKSANQAKERLKLVLSHDRTDLPPGVLEALKDEIVDLISRHVNVDRDAVRFEMTQEGREQRLVADIPLLSDSHRRRR